MFAVIGGTYQYTGCVNAWLAGWQQQLAECMHSGSAGNTILTGCLVCFLYFVDTVPTLTAFNLSSGLCRQPQSDWVVRTAEGVYRCICSVCFGGVVLN